MMNQPRAFNIILILLSFSLVACQTTEEGKKKKEKSSIRIHLETNRDGTQHNSTVPVYRANPTYITVERNATLDEAFIKKAELVDVDELGGFAIKLTFDDTGRQRLDYLTTAHKGRRLVISAGWTEDRWIAAPLITRRIDNGILIFTPDASREEVERIISGLENVIKELSKPYVF